MLDIVFIALLASQVARMVFRPNLHVRVKIWTTRASGFAVSGLHRGKTPSRHRTRLARVLSVNQFHSILSSKAGPLPQQLSLLRASPPHQLQPVAVPSIRYRKHHKDTRIWNRACLGSSCSHLTQRGKSKAKQQGAGTA